MESLSHSHRFKYGKCCAKYGFHVEAGYGILHAMNEVKDSNAGTAKIMFNVFKSSVMPVTHQDSLLK